METAGVEVEVGEAEVPERGEIGLIRTTMNRLGRSRRRKVSGFCYVLFLLVGFVISVFEKSIIYIAL